MLSSIWRSTCSCETSSVWIGRPSFALGPSTILAVTRSNSNPFSVLRPTIHWRPSCLWRKKARRWLMPVALLWSIWHFDGRRQTQIPLWRVSDRSKYHNCSFSHWDGPFSLFFLFKSQLKLTRWNCKSSWLVSSKSFALDAWEFFIWRLWCRSFAALKKLMLVFYWEALTEYDLDASAIYLRLKEETSIYWLQNLRLFL